MGRGAPRGDVRPVVAQNAIAFTFSTSPAVNRPPSAKPHSRAICFSIPLGLPHLHWVYLIILRSIRPH